MQEKEILRKFIFEEIVKESKIDYLDNNESLLQGGVIDSLNILQLLAFIEEKFSIKIKDEELIPENFETINTITSLIQRKLSEPLVSKSF